MGDELDEEAALMWQDALDEVAAGRTQTLRCPHCLKGELSVTRNEQTRRTRLECRGCKRFIEVRLADVIG